MNSKTEITDELAAKQFAIGQTNSMLLMTTGIQNYLDAAECLDDETKTDLEEIETSFLKIKTRME